MASSFQYQVPLRGLRVSEQTDPGPGAGIGAVSLSSSDGHSLQGPGNLTLAFGTLYTSYIEQKTLTLENTGTDPISVSTSLASGAQGFASFNHCPAELEPTESCSVNVSFHPVSEGAFSDTLTINTSAGAFTVTLNGTGLADPDITVDLRFSQGFVNLSDGKALIPGGSPLPSIQDGAVWFGNSGWLMFEDEPSFALGPNEDFTFQTWLYMTEQVPGNFAYMLVNTGASAGFALQYGNGSWTGHTRAFALTKRHVADYYIPYTLPVKEWTHVALVRHQGTLRAYVNGVEVGSRSLSNVSFEGGGQGIGAPSPTSRESPIRGAMADVQFVKKALYTGNFTPPPLTAGTPAP